MTNSTPAADFTAKEKRLFRQRLLGWYQTSRRPLPWRTTQDPYRIRISEILLQQTQVKTGIGYYERFLERFPNLEELAQASPDEVLQVWEGLGYYGRARNLHRAAHVLTEQHDGKLPSDPEALKRLPGIGPYTAAAIASIAFGRDVPVVDGNVMRVLCRVFDLREDPRSPSVQKKLWRIAAELLPRGQAADHNQAVMELGALVCLPGRPNCPTCPVSKVCRALQAGTAEQLPVRTPKAAPPTRRRVVALIRSRGRVLFSQRPPNGLLGGLWELPGLYREEKETDEQARARLRSMLQPIATLEVVPGSEFTVRHAYSHFREELRVMRYRVLKTGRHRSKAAKNMKEPAVAWLLPNQMMGYPFTGATRKIMNSE